MLIRISQLNTPDNFSYSKTKQQLMNKWTIVIMRRSSRKFNEIRRIKEFGRRIRFNIIAWEENSVESTFTAIMTKCFPLIS